jgi:hypothetical protein
VPVRNFELAMECSGSFLVHCSIAKTDPDGRELLMNILEPLLGAGVDFAAYLGGVNHYTHSRLYFEGRYPQGENTLRFLDEATKGWKKKKH